MNTGTPLCRPLRRLAALGSTLAVVSGCQFGGLNSLDMPGTMGHGPGSFTVTVELPDVSTLPQNSPVLVDDVTVGSVSGQQVKQRPDGTFYAALQLSLNSDVHLPANATVTLGQTSLLGSQHVQLAAPSTEPPDGKLSDGASIPLERAGRYPSTEEVLSTLGVVVNKGNLGALQDITDEIYAAVAGHTGQFANLLPQLADLTNAVDRQSSDIVTAMESINQVASKFARNDTTVTTALAALPAATRTLNANAGRIVDTFAALHRFSEIAAQILAQTKTDIAADVTAAYAVLKPLSDHAQELIDGLPIIATYPFPQSGIKHAVRGDYLNAIATLDLTQRRFGENVFTTSPLDPNMKHLSEIVTAPDFLIGEQANLSGQAADPFAIPPAPAPTPTRPR
ncbi:MCE family protein [Mycolicibacterium nivoides]|uniref:MCE family protein n=1 Tax=Mycolicibacterium nivoides TaxID=2487344 RepID=A0ABW9LH62_9MYCO